MASALKLRVVEGGLRQGESRNPVPVPTVAADRWVGGSRGARWPAVILFIASLAVHAAVIVAVMDVAIWGEPPAEGGSNETIIIASVSADALDDAPPMVAASEIQFAERATIVEDRTAPVPDRQPAKMVEPASAHPLQPDPALRAADEQGFTPPVAARETAGDVPVAVDPPADVAATGSTATGSAPEHTVVAAAPDPLAATRPDERVAAGNDVDPTAPIVAGRSTVALPEGQATPDGEALAAGLAPPDDRLASTAAPAAAQATEPTTSAVTQVATTPAADDEPAGAGEVAEAAPVDARRPAEIGGATVAPSLDERAALVEADIAAAAPEATPEPASAKPVPAAKPQPGGPQASTPSVAGKAARGPTSGKAGAGGAKGGAGKATLSSYNARLSAHLRTYRTYPPEAAARHMTGSALVSFTIDRSGRVLSAKLSRGTGYAVLDKAASAMVRRASPFPPIPAELGTATVTATAPIRFAPR